NFELSETVVHGDTITVHGNNALEAINRVAAVSVTPFSIQDVNRYAAAFQDPSRMAENFAGVFGKGTSNNYIVVRGGSPIELLWRLDGIDITKHNHLGKNGSSGGLISAINTEMLGNSDFLTGAFPAEYGTKLSAVFDLHTRDGNNEKIEGEAGLSFNGMEAIVEGPVPVSDGSSFLVSYRHSTLSFLRELKILDYTDLPNFDDAMMKLHVKLGERDLLSGTGLWGNAYINDTYTSNSELGQGSGILVGGLDWEHLFSDQFINHFLINYVDNTYNEGVSGGTEKIDISNITAKEELTYTPNKSHSFEIGLEAQRGTYTIDQPDFVFNTSLKLDLYMAYVNWNWHIIPEFVLNTGLYSEFIRYDAAQLSTLGQFLNAGSLDAFPSSYEPRASLSWSPAEEHTFAIAFGVHRQPEPLEFTQALHYVAGYTFKPSPDILLKVEGYEKDYSHVPVHALVKDSYSFLNEGFAQRIDYGDLVSTGTGKSYGAEFTLLKHYSSGYYITATASYVRQQFAGSDGIPHFGSFDNRYILNLVTGYDIPLTSSSMLTLSEKFTIAGGGMYTPIDLAASSAAGYEILDSAHAFGARNPPYIRLDLNAEFHFNWSGSSFTIFASVLNALNIKNVQHRFVDFSYDASGNIVAVIKEDLDLPILPIIGLKYEF
ncbi:MAG: TonB-dependent receptor plug domain-containing protein, partial [Candidatus Kapaibacterium sp.]